MTDELIPIAMFMCITIVFCVFFWFRFRARSETQQTIRTALDKGHELTPDIIERLGAPKAAKFKDLRLGVIWLSLAAALVLAGMAIPEEDALRGLLTGAAFPFCIGAAYLLLHRLTNNR